MNPSETQAVLAKMEALKEEYKVLKASLYKQKPKVVGRVYSWDSSKYLCDYYLVVEYMGTMYLFDDFCTVYKGQIQPRTLKFTKLAGGALKCETLELNDPDGHTTNVFVPDKGPALSKDGNTFKIFRWFWKDLHSQCDDLVTTIANTLRCFSSDEEAIKKECYKHEVVFWSGLGDSVNSWYGYDEGPNKLDRLEKEEGREMIEAMIKSAVSREAF